MAIQTVDAKTLKSWLDSNQAVLVDVREPGEYRSEHIAGSVLLPLGSVCKQALPEIGERKLAIHCRKGGRGNSACHKLMTEDPELMIYNLEGGIEGWQAAGFPVAQGTRKILPLDRQVQLTVGIILVLVSFFGLSSANPNWLWGSALIGAGLSFAGITGFCGLARLLALMPWNK